MKHILLITLSFLLWTFGFFPNTVFASTESIQNFDTKITAHQDGSFNVLETIKYDFGDNERHGIYRDIPTLTKVGELFRQSKINFTNISRDGLKENFSTSYNSNKVSVKIGKANQTINGAHTYSISYIVTNGIGSNYEDHDEIYWNVTGNEWQIPILSASASITTDFGIESNKAACFTGTQGSKEQNCTYPSTPPFNPITTTLLLSPYQGLTVVFGFPVNTFPKSTLSTRSPAESDFLFFVLLCLGVVVLLNFIAAPILLIWYLKHKRKNRFGPITVNFDFPKTIEGKRISPAEAGSIDVYRVDQNDVIATIFDLAIRKYLKIEQVKQKKVLGIFGGSEDYVFTKLLEFSEKMEPFELTIASTLFADENSINLSSLKKDFYITFAVFEKDVFDSLISKGLYSKNPKNQMVLLLVAGIFSIFLGGILLGPLLIFLSRKLNGRTQKGDEIDFKIDGLKLFLKNMSREHTWYAKNLIMVEKYIPYAISLGYIKEFMDQLKVIYPNYQPNWYSGNMAFYAVSNSLVSSMSSGFTTSAPSSSSGFSGGGSSGGGGGGGGGGSW